MIFIHRQPPEAILEQAAGLPSPRIEPSSVETALRADDANVKPAGCPGPARGLAAAARPCYISPMTRLLEEAVATVASLPDEQQDEFARILLQLAGHQQPVYVLTSEEEADLDASIAAEQRGDFATDEEMLAIRAKYAR